MKRHLLSKYASDTEQLVLLMLLTDVEQGYT